MPEGLSLSFFIALSKTTKKNERGTIRISELMNRIDIFIIMILIHGTCNRIILEIE